MMLNTELPPLDVLLVEEWLATVRPDAADRALEVGPHLKSDWGISRANAPVHDELGGWGEDWRNGGKGVACGWLPAEGAREEEHDETHAKDDCANPECVLNDAHG